MTILTLLAALLLSAFAFITFAVVPFVTRPAMLFDKGPAHARMMGILICAVVAVAVLFVMNPDHMIDLKPRFWEAAGLAGFSAIFWLPWYLFAFTRRANLIKATTPRDRS
jgi:protein-S-isoprenylcysteine O-methyltransferase Ste14